MTGDRKNDTPVTITSRHGVRRCYGVSMANTKNSDSGFARSAAAITANATLTASVRRAYDSGSMSLGELATALRLGAKRRGHCLTHCEPVSVVDALVGEVVS